MSERDRMRHADNGAVPNVPNINAQVKRTKLFYIIFILGIIGAGVVDFPRNFIKLTKLEFTPFWCIILAIILCLFRICYYLAFPFFVYYLLVDLLRRIMGDGRLMAILRRFLFELKEE